MAPLRGRARRALAQHHRSLAADPLDGENEIVGRAHAQLRHFGLDDDRPGPGRSRPAHAQLELHAVPDDRRIAEAGWDRATVGDIVRTLGDGSWLGEYFDGEQRVPIILRAGGEQTPEQLAQTPVMGEIGAMLKPRWMVARTLRETYADPGKLTEAQIRRHHDLMRRDGNRDATLQRLRTAKPLDPAPLKSLHVATLILWGGKDQWVPLADARRLHADIAGSELVIYDNAAHVPMEEIPDRSAADVRRFLSK